MNSTTDRIPQEDTDTPMTFGPSGGGPHGGVVVAGNEHHMGIRVIEPTSDTCGKSLRVNLINGFSRKGFDIVEPQIRFSHLPLVNPFSGAQRHELYGIVSSQCLERREPRNTVGSKDRFYATDLHAGTAAFLLTPISRLGHNRGSHRTYWTTANRIPTSRLVIPLLYVERRSLLREVQWNGHTGLKFVLTNR